MVQNRYKHVIKCHTQKKSDSLTASMPQGVTAGIAKCTNGKRIRDKKLVLCLQAEGVTVV